MGVRYQISIKSGSINVPMRTQQHILSIDFVGVDKLEAVTKINSEESFMRRRAITIGFEFCVHVYIQEI